MLGEVIAQGKGAFSTKRTYDEPGFIFNPIYKNILTGEEIGGNDKRSGIVYNGASVEPPLPSNK